MNCVSCDLCVYHLGLFVFFPRVFLSSRVTGACPVTTDLIMRGQQQQQQKLKYRLFLDLSAASCKFGFSVNMILNFFAIFSSFLSSKLNFLPFAANLPPEH